MSDGNGFSNKEILLDLRQDMKDLKLELAGLLLQHNSRISSLERWRERFRGAAKTLAAAVTVAAVVVPVVALLIK